MNGLGEYTYLAKGMKGNAVMELQNDLLKLGFKLPQYGADGSFGTETETAVKNFQYTYGLPVTGIVDQATANAIKNALVSEYAYIAPKVYSAPAPATPKIPIPAPVTPTIPSGIKTMLAGLDWKWIGLGFLGVMVAIYMLTPKASKR